MGFKLVEIIGKYRIRIVLYRTIDVWVDGAMVQ